MTASELRAIWDRTLHGDMPHVEELTVTAAVICELLREHGMEATLVGGAAIEFHAPAIYVTTDLDFVVQGRSRAELDRALTEFGFARHGRHWVLDDVFVEVPGNWMSDPVEIVRVGPLRLRVVRREIVLADRIIGFKHWRTTAYGAQALALLGTFGASLDDAVLRTRLRSEQAEDALDALIALSKRGDSVGENELEQLLDTLHAPRRGHDA